MEIMTWTSRDFEPQLVSSTLLTSTQQVLSSVVGMPQTKEPVVEATPIVEYNGRMRIMGTDKLEMSCYVSVVNFYLNQGDMEKRKGAKGALVLCMETENASKFYKGVGLKFSDDEDDASMMAACGQFTQKVAETFKDALAGRGYGPLVSSPPRNYKNSVVEGVEFSPDQKTKHEISFFYMKHKALTVDLSLASIPKK